MAEGFFTIDLDPSHSVKIGERQAGEVIRVGAHLAINAAGQWVEAGPGTPTGMLAAEAPETGKGIFENDGTTISTYVNTEMVDAIIPQTGGRAHILLADGQNVTTGTFLEPVANGEWQAQAAGIAGFVAAEAINNATGAAVFIMAHRV